MEINLTDYKLVQKLPEDLSCSICLNVIQQPQMVNCCEKLFCDKCLMKWKEKNNSCPCCRNQDFTHMEMQTTVRKVESLQVYCPNSQHGCQAILAIRDCELHLFPDNPDGCLYATLLCPNGCGKDIFRASLDKHCNTDCPKRQETCPHCGESGWYQEMKEEHPQKCLLYPLPCPQKCEIMVARKDLPSHQNVCPMQQVQCPFKDAGCSENIIRKNMEEHLATAMTIHLLQLTSSQGNFKEKMSFMVKSLQQDCKQLQQKNLAMETKLSQVGCLLQGMRVSTRENERVCLKLGQLETILTDTSVMTIGACVSLELSKKTNQGHHFIIVNRVKFMLEWIYRDKTLELELFLAESRPLPDGMSCEFLVKVEPHQDESGSTSNAASIIRILAVVCCGTPQYSHEDAYITSKKPIGPSKTVYVNSDTSLTLTVQEHGHVLTHKPSLLRRKSCDLSMFFANAQPCQCDCHYRHHRQISLPTRTTLVRRHAVKRESVHH